jgi:hypothetical protein
MEWRLIDVRQKMTFDIDTSNIKKYQKPSMVVRLGSGVPIPYFRICIGDQQLHYNEGSDNHSETTVPGT